MMQVRVDKPVYGGDGLARAEDGRVLLVPFALPGELVEVSAGDGQSEARLVDVVERSAERVAPGCVHFGRCGGCQYQHAAYAEQLRMKRAILEETMERSGVRRWPEVEVHAAEPWGYRNRVRMRLVEVSGELRVGYSQRGTNTFLPIVECPIAAPLLWRAATTLLQVGMADDRVRRALREVDEVELFCDGAEQRLGVTLFSAKPAAGAMGVLARVCDGVRARVPQISGGGWVVSVGRAGRDRVLATWGADGVMYEAAGQGYWVSRGGFFQVNRWMVDDLVRLVTEGRRGTVAWDLFAGIGLFARVLATRFGSVTAVESSEVAVGDLRRALARLGPQHRAVGQTVLTFLRQAVLERERPETVVLDPPRAGAGVEICSILGRVGAPEVTYVSCDPTTLCRDLRALLDSGYDLAALHLVDLFPQTFHMETVAVLRR